MGQHLAGVHAAPAKRGELQFRWHAVAQHISNALLACAKLRKQPDTEDLQLLVQMFSQPEVLEGAAPQALANIMWGVSQLNQLRSWRGGVSEQELQQLLGEEQLELLVAQDVPQAVANVLLALGRFATGPAPVLSRSFAQAAARPLLAGAVQQCLRGWPPQEISNSLWACGVLGLAHEQFVSAAVASAPQWVPRSIAPNLTQAAKSAVQLQLQDEGFVRLLLQRAKQLAVQGQQRRQGVSNQGRNTAQRHTDAATAAYVSWAVAGHATTGSSSTGAGCLQREQRAVHHARGGEISS